MAYIGTYNERGRNLARAQYLTIRKEHREITDKNGNRTTFSASSADNTPNFLAPLKRLAFTSAQFTKKNSLGRGELFTHRGKQNNFPWQPRITGQRSAEQARVVQARP